MNRGVLVAQSGDNRRALLDYSKSIRLDEGNVTARVNRGLAYEVLGDLQNACLDREKASTLGDSEALTWVHEKCAN